MGHIEDRFWKKNGKGPFASTNFLELLVNDEEATLTKLNWLCGVKHNVFSKVKIPKCKLPILTSTFGVGIGKLNEEENKI